MDYDASSLLFTGRFFERAINLDADLLKKRATRSEFTFDDVLQPDAMPWQPCRGWSFQLDGELHVCSNIAASAKESRRMIEIKSMLE